jgi:hypothetical protein
MKSLESYLGCGRYVTRNNKNFGEFTATKLNHLTEFIISFFDKYPIVGVKAKNFNSFKKAAELMNNKAHLTYEGLKKIKQIKEEMNQ